MISQTDLSKLVTLHNLFITNPDVSTDVLGPLLGNPAGYPHLFKAIWKQTGKVECLDKVTYGQEKFFSAETTHKTRQLAIESLFAKNEIVYLSAILSAPHRRAEYLSILASFAPKVCLEIENRLDRGEPFIEVIGNLFIQTSLTTWVSKGTKAEEREAIKKEIQDYLSSQTKTSLNFYGSYILSLPDIFHLPQFQRLESINIARNRLSSLPQSMQYLTHLKRLSLEENQLSSLPPWIEKLSHLEALNLSINPISELPAWLGSLSTLQELDVSHTKLSFLPTELHKLIKLETLCLQNTEIETIPVWLRSMPHLKQIYYDIPSDIAFYFTETEATNIAPLIIPVILATALFYLRNEEAAKASDYLRDTPFQFPSIDESSLEKAITSSILDAYVADTNYPLENRAEVRRRIEAYLETRPLKSLDLSGLSLLTIPNFLYTPYFSTLLQFNSLDLSSNAFTSIPLLEPFFPQLISLSLHSNPFTHHWDPENKVTDWLSFLKNDYLLFIITTMQTDMVKGQPLIDETINFANAFHTCMNSLHQPGAYLLTTVETWFLQKALNHWISGEGEGENRAEAKDIILHTCRSARYPPQLSLKYLGLKSLPDIFHLSIFKNMWGLYLSHNQLDNLPESLALLSHLRTLSLSHNSFATFPLVLTKMTTLAYLPFSSNHLSFIPHQIQGMQGLKKLSLDHNCFTSIPYTTYLLPHLEILTLNDNPLPKTFKPLQNWIPFLDEHPAARFYSEAAVRNWLIKGKQHMAAYTQLESQIYMQNTLKYLLEKAEINEHFREHFLEIVSGATATCIDGITLSLLHLRIADLQLSIDPSNLEETFSTLKTLSIFGILETLAMQKIQSEKDHIDQGIADGIPLTAEQREYGKYVSVHRFDREIFLIYPSRLKERFNLPFDLSEMLFGQMAPITAADIEEAARIVEATISDPDKLHPLLIQNPLWLEALKRKAPERYAFIENEVETLSIDPATAIEAKAKQAELRTKLSQDLMGACVAEVDKPAAAKRTKLLK